VSPASSPETRVRSERMLGVLCNGEWRHDLEVR
jgi:hypothetical protein